MDREGAQNQADGMIRASSAASGLAVLSCAAPSCARRVAADALTMLMSNSDER